MTDMTGGLKEGFDLVDILQQKALLALRYPEITTPIHPIHLYSTTVPLKIQTGAVYKEETLVWEFSHRHFFLPWCRGTKT